MVKNIAAAWQLLLSLPLPLDTRDGSPGSWIWLPGLVVGLILSAIGLLEPWVSTLVLGGVMVFVEILLTGGLHIDGWADCWDGWGARHNPTKVVVAMKDSRIGSLGAASLIVLLVIKLVLYGAVAGTWVLVPIHMFSRAVLPLSALIFPSREQGFGATFAGLITPFHVGVNLVIPGLALWVVAGFMGIALIPALFMGLLFAGYFSPLAGGLGGDILGGAQEVTLVSLLMLLEVLL